MAGFENDVLVCENVNFNPALPKPHLGTITTNGQLIIGSTALNAGGTHINIGSLTSPDSSLTIGYSSPNITLTTGPSGGTLRTLTPNEDFDGTPATPISGTSGNINVLGANPSFSTVTDTFNTTGLATGTLDIEHRAWLTGLVVDASTTRGSRGTFATIAAALTASVSGQTIFIRTGTYTENLTLKAGVNLTAFGSDSSGNGTGKVIISGTCTFTAAGSVTISGIQLQTNSAALLAVTGSAASIVNLENCYINCTNNTGITFSTSDSNGRININRCNGDIGTTGISLYAHTSAGQIFINHSFITNTGASTTAANNASGMVRYFSSAYSGPISTSSTGGFTFDNSQCALPTNTTALTLNGTGNTGAQFSYTNSGSASGVSIGTGATFIAVFCEFASSNTNYVTGLGTLQYVGISSGNQNNAINPTVQTGGIMLGSKNTAPSAGYIGEQISSVVTAVSFTTTVPKNMTSISLTAGVWDISIIGYAAATGANISAFVTGISTVSATFQGSYGDQQLITFGTTALSSLNQTISAFRVVISSTTTYYFVAQINAGGTVTGNGRISATRVG